MSDMARTDRMQCTRCGWQDTAEMMPYHDCALTPPTASVPEDGGPAYPVEIDGVQYPGMSLRDRIAEKAMQGLLASGIARDGNYQPERVALYAYVHADAMLRVRRQYG